MCYVYADPIYKTNQTVTDSPFICLSILSQLGKICNTQVYSDTG